MEEYLVTRAAFEGLDDLVPSEPPEGWGIR
jgi:hypothetical protein